MTTVPGRRARSGRILQQGEGAGSTKGNAMIEDKLLKTAAVATLTALMGKKDAAQ